MASKGEGCPPKPDKGTGEGGPLYYVYRLQSLKNSDEKYTGFTSDINRRLDAHNNGQVPHTSKFKPWKMMNYFAFDDEKMAMAFEQYLKSGSGRAFADRHF